MTNKSTTDKYIHPLELVHIEHMLHSEKQTKKDLRKIPRQYHMLASLLTVTYSVSVGSNVSAMITEGFTLERFLLISGLCTLWMVLLLKLTKGKNSAMKAMQEYMYDCLLPEINRLQIYHQKSLEDILKDHGREI